METGGCLARSARPGGGSRPAEEGWGQEQRAAGEGGPGQTLPLQDMPFASCSALFPGQAAEASSRSGASVAQHCNKGGPEGAPGAGHPDFAVSLWGASGPLTLSRPAHSDPREPGMAGKQAVETAPMAGHALPAMPTGQPGPGPAPSSCPRRLWELVFCKGGVNQPPGPSLAQIPQDPSAQLPNGVMGWNRS